MTGPEALTLQEEKLRPREAGELSRTSEQMAELERVPGVVPDRECGSSKGVGLGNAGQASAEGSLSLASPPASENMGC